MQLELTCQPDSPLARRVIATAIETGLADQLKVSPSGLPESTVKPVGRWFGEPILETGDGERLIGVERICAFLDSLQDQPKLLPKTGEARLELEQVQACADDLLEATEAWYREQCWDRHVADSATDRINLERIEKALDTLEGLVGEILVPPVTTAHIAVACALDWLDLRAPLPDWMSRYSNLSRWYKTFCDRPSMRETEPELP